MSRTALALLLASTLSACGSDEPTGPTDAEIAQIPYETLAEYGLFLDDGSSQEPAPGTVPYATNVVLFADYTIKHRFIRLPATTTITYDNLQKWQFPVGTIIVKTFAQPVDLRDLTLGERLIETRLLIREPVGFTAHTYLWNDEQTAATRVVAGAQVPVSWIHTDGSTRQNNFQVPNTNQCKNCHGQTGETDVIGVRTRQLNRDNDYGAGPVNQLDHFATLGLFAGALTPNSGWPRLADPFGAASVDERARAYLDVNCGHCHNPAGAAQSSGLYFSFETTDPITLGLCRPPVAAGPAAGGRPYDITPGLPDESIVVFRMQSVDPQIRMPELGRELTHVEAVDLVTQWITDMTPVGCN